VSLLSDNWTGKKAVDDLYGDYTGNRIVVLKTKAKNPLKIMLVGHCNECGNYFNY
jgi:hypothetical protein